MSQGILENPPTEAEIVARWNPERGALVSVCMLAFNHAPYIRNALNSVLNQKTDFGFEILVHDDASKDGTADILREYAKRYPAIVKPILQTVNQHSQGIYPSVHFNYPRANLPFVAMCEGDDHWTDEGKLQRQVDGLLAHPELNLSFHSAIRVDRSSQGKAPKIFGDYATVDTVLPFSDVLHRVRGWIPFASCMIRQAAKVRFLEFLKNNPYLTIGEIYFQIFGSMPAGALFFAQPMSVYHFGTEYSWTRSVLSNSTRRAAHEKAMIRSYLELDALTGRAYHDNFVVLVLQRLLWLFNPPPPPESIASTGVAHLATSHAACQTAIGQTLDRLAGSSSRYIIFGCASGCQRILQSLPPEKIVAIVDRDNRRSGELLQDKPIIGTDGLASYADADLLVSTLTANRAAIFELAEAAGIPTGRIHFMFDTALDYLDAHPIPPESLGT